MNIIIEYLLFIGSALYLASGFMFLYLFFRTLRTKDGLGLAFLKYLTLSLSLGSFTIFLIRILSEYGKLSFMAARAVAVVNPILMVAIALYLNYLFHLKATKGNSQDTKNIKEIKEDVKIVKSDVKEIKKNQ